MPSNSETILSANTHPGDSTVETLTGDKFKGDGYYGRADGVHTVQYNFEGLTGTITIQGSLSSDPADTDWFEVHSYIASQETANKFANFTGNYVWIRAKVVYTDGTINSILLNHQEIIMHSITVVWPKVEEDVDAIIAENVVNCSGGALTENETHYEIYESDKGETVLVVETHNALDHEESDEVAENIANRLFDLGFSKFDIEISVQTYCDKYFIIEYYKGTIA